jgi:SAM-dependent methyltransferase
VKRVAAAALALGVAATQAEETEWRVPFVTTPHEVVDRMLKMAETRAEDLVIDLGSGDGRIVIAAAKNYGARGIGVELDGILVETSNRNAELAKVADKVRFVQGDALVADLSRATVVTVYLLPALMRELQPRFIQLAPGTRIVSHAFSMAGWLPDRSETVRLERRHLGQGDESRIHLWVVPADVRGIWRAPGVEFRIEQNFQKIDVAGAGGATLAGRDIAWSGFRGRVEGNRIVGELEGRPIVLER